VTFVRFFVIIVYEVHVLYASSVVVFCAFLVIVIFICSCFLLES